MTNAGLGWQAQIWIIMIPTLIYAYLFMDQEFPKPKVEAAASVSENLKAMASPVYLFILACMALTAISEFGPQQWTSLIMSNSGAHPMVILALITGLMGERPSSHSSSYGILSKCPYIMTFHLPLPSIL